ncbi:MAG: hypothetical protein HY940_01025 [Gammaproteobacteria bacterium]|nr:hypothetical protein [Gammaproteobacteria bacterium]
MVAYYMKRFINACAGGTLAIMISAPAWADDTEIYMGTNNLSTVLPNIVFIIDTSGSMSTMVDVVNGIFDPNQIYDGVCDPAKIYWQSTTAGSSTTPPSCASNNQWFDASKNFCLDSSVNLGDQPHSTGVYVGRLARYGANKKNFTWQNLSSSVHTDSVECQADWGIHGNGGANNYPANSTNGGPWRANSTNAVNWNSVGGSYTLYSANYLNWANGSSGFTQKSRLEIVKEVFGKVMDSTAGVNITVVRYDGDSGTSNKGGYFLLPMTQVTDVTRPTIKQTVNNLTAAGNTPLAETMYEVARFYRGENVKFGNSTTPGQNHSDVLVTGNSSKYNTPVQYQCQKNFTVLLTDGDPTSDYDADADIALLPGFNSVAGSCSFNNGNDCLDELSKYMYSADQSTALPGTQNSVNYFIGFTTAQQLLSDAALKGGGKYYTVDNITGLTEAFTAILTQILAVNTMFVAPAVPVNAFNRLTHRGELYYALFKPGLTPDWAGNIKRYGFGGNPVDVRDVNGALAVDANTGFFSSTSTSYWTPVADAPDGDEVGKGGAISVQTANRNIFTYTGGVDPVNVSLISANNLFHENNALITKAMLNINAQTDQYRIDLMKWSRGVDIFDENANGSVTDARHAMGDPLHSNPLLINYGGTANNPDITLFVGTNEGFLHAINASDGSERFSFIPPELLPNLEKVYEDLPTVPHPYGMDGQITGWVNDANNNGVILDVNGNVESGEFVYIYAGMRRGGMNYYALNVTDRSNPVLKWEIKGGTGDFAELAETWSRPSLAKLKLNGVTHTVLVFGGGYDTTQDTIGGHLDDTAGRAIYIVDADTGQRLWWAGPAGSGADLVLTDMTNSVPGGVVPVDIDGDGYINTLFFGDMTGQLWRFDFDMANTGSVNLARGGVIASLGGAAVADNRRFYYKPDVSLMQTATGNVYAITIGSGYREHPLDTQTIDRFYMVMDSNVSVAPISYTTLTEADLTDVTNTLAPNLSNSKGWYIRLAGNLGEKVLAESRTFGGYTTFTTFTPVAANNANTCAPSQGVGRTYIVKTADASPAFNLDNLDANLTLSDRSLVLTRGGIPPEPTIIFPPDGSDPVILVGADKIGEAPLKLPVQRTYWQIRY